jgi:hypothetical protein
MPETRISKLLILPEKVRKGDFILNLSKGVTKFVNAFGRSWPARSWSRTGPSEPSTVSAWRSETTRAKIITGSSISSSNRL